MSPRLNALQFRTAWVYCHVGRAHYERMEYGQAVTSFDTARTLDRCRVESMEVFSTVLWHAKKASALSLLAQEMVAVDRLAPQVRTPAFL